MHRPAELLGFGSPQKPVLSSRPIRGSCLVDSEDQKILLFMAQKMAGGE